MKPPERAKEQSRTGLKREFLLGFLRETSAAEHGDLLGIGDPCPGLTMAGEWVCPECTWDSHEPSCTCVRICLDLQQELRHCVPGAPGYAMGREK